MILACYYNNIIFPGFRAYRPRQAGREPAARAFLLVEFKAVLQKNIMNSQSANTIRNLFLAGLSGVLMTGAFPNIEFSGLIWFALTPLMIALQEQSPAQGFRLGFFAGCVHYTTLMYWLAYTLMTFGHMPFYLSLPILLLLVGYMALYPAVFAAVFSWIHDRPAGWLAILPALWAALEYIRSFFLSGFPWEFLGYSQYRHIYMIQIADITGVYGVSFLIVAVNTALFLLWRGWAERRTSRCMLRRAEAAGGAAIAVLLVIHVLAYGQWRTHLLDTWIAKAPAPEFTVVQGNIDQSEKWDPAFQIATIEKYIRLSESAKDSSTKPHLVVWPETAAPFYFLSMAAPTEQVIDGIRKTGCDFLIGSPSFVQKDENHVNYYNSAFLMSSNGEFLGKYDKVHLVPFGEYVPLHQWFPFIGKMVEGVGDFRSGKEGHTLVWGQYPLGIQICYEMIFPDLARKMVRNHAAFLINMTNDAWYGRTSAPYQHFSMAVFRAVENHRSLIRAANTGISGFIDPAGRIVATTPIFTSAALTRTMPVMTMESFYTRYGDIFSRICLGISVLLSLFVFFKNRQWAIKKPHCP